MNDKGQKLWDKAKNIIPGGSQLLSKRSEMFLPNQWPSYYKKAKGVNIWDLDGNKYTDMSIMGIGTCLLGYANDTVNEAVKKVIDDGNMATLNSYEEVELAESLLRLHPWAGGVRYARTGGEIVTIAIRLARAYSGKDNIAFCGYHGWHDWYLSTNLNEGNNLEGHLLPGLLPKGVPKILKNTAFPFNYNDLTKLEDLIIEKDIGTIIMEPVRNMEPDPNFINGINKLVAKYNLVLVIDEITSGWRSNLPGIYEKIGLKPHMITYAKAMSNGYPMATLIGTSEVMDMAELSFISSAYWTSRIGPAASLSTIEQLYEYRVPKYLYEKSKYIKDQWQKLSIENEIDINIGGYLPIPYFNFNYDQQSLALKTLFNQFMLEKNYLATNVVYLSYPHTQEIIDQYLNEFDDVFQKLSKIIGENSIMSHLKGPIVHSGFKRLT